MVRKCGEAEISLKEMTEILMKDTKKDDGGLSGIYPPEFEYLLSSIFVEATNTPAVLIINSHADEFNYFRIGLIN